MDRETVVDGLDRGVSLWTDHLVRNEHSTAEGLAVRRLLCDWLGRARPLSGELLEACYAGVLPQGSDVENLLFNNIDQGASAYRAACASGLRFSWLGPKAPLTPAGEARAHFYRYSFTERTAPPAGILLGPPARSWQRVPVLDGFRSLPGQRLSTRVWWSLRQVSPQRTGTLPPDAFFAIRLTLHGREIVPAIALKGGLDGVVAALQVQVDIKHAEHAAAQLAGDGPEAPRIKQLLVEHPDPVLGTVEHLLTRTQDANALRWRPADARCIAAAILLGDADTVASIDVDVGLCALFSTN